MDIGKYITESKGSFDLLGESTNSVYRIMLGDESCILKKNRIPVDNLSPFWYSIKEVFGSDFNTQRKNIYSLTSFLNTNPHIKVAELVVVSDEYCCQIFREAGGVKYKPDEFPDKEEIEYQLGLYIGFLHSIRFDTFGTFPPEKKMEKQIKDAMICCMEQVIDLYWQKNEDVQTTFRIIREMKISPESYSLIMPDISGNQFVYSDGLDAVTAVVDLDAYVIGPREWELAVVEQCLRNGSAFVKGYESYQEFPDITESRSFYRFFSYLCDPWTEKDLNTFMTEHILF